MSERGVKVVGILGGMGPAATVDFYGKLVAATPASRDQDHVPVVMWADPRVPDRTAALIGDGVDPTPALRAGIHALAAAGAELLAVACNTAHAFIPSLACEAGLELVSIVDVTASFLQTTFGRRATVGLLATEGTVRSSLYANACDAMGIEVVVPNTPDQVAVSAAIAAVKAGVVTPGTVAQLHGVIDRLRHAGAGAVIAGCTEIVLVLGTGPVHGLPMIDPATLLAREVVRRSLGRARPTSSLCVAT